jgi:hypothetical protein
MDGREEKNMKNFGKEMWGNVSLELSQKAAGFVIF